MKKDLARKKFLYRLINIKLAPKQSIKENRLKTWNKIYEEIYQKFIFLKNEGIKQVVVWKDEDNKLLQVSFYLSDKISIRRIIYYPTPYKVPNDFIKKLTKLLDFKINVLEVENFNAINENVVAD